MTKGYRISVTLLYICTMSVGLRGYFDESDTIIRRGRSVELLSRRDEKLAARFYYYSNLRKFNFESTINNLHLEFDLAERVIIDRLKSNQEHLDKFFKDKPSAIELKRKFPYFNW